MRKRFTFGIALALLLSALALPNSRAQQSTTLSLPTPVYALVQGADNVSFAATAAGVYRSTDRVTWQRSGLAGASVYALLTDPREGKRIYAAADTGAFVSEDGGSNWQSGLSLSAYALAVDPTPNPAIIYAAANGGIYTSSDSGKSWQEQGLHGHHIAAIAFDGGLDNAYAGDWAGLYRRAKGGNWEAVPSLVKATNATQGVAVNGIAITKTSHNVYVATSRGLYRSADGNGGWVELGETTPCDFITVYSDDDHILYASFNGRLKKSEDGGNGWAVVNEVPTMHVYSVLNVQNQTWYGGDSGIFSGTDLTTNAPNLPITSLAVGQVRDTEGVLQEAWLAVAGGNLYYSKDKGQSWQAPNNDLAGPINAVLQTQGQLVVATATGLYSSDNAGASWLRSDVPGCTSFTSLAPNPNQPTNIYAGCASGGVYLSKDRGQRWQALPNVGLPADPPIVTVDRTAPSTLLALLPSHAAAVVYRSVDGGQNWRSTALGLPADVQPVSLAVAPQAAPRSLNLTVAEPSPATVYLAAADGRLFASADGGRNWAILANTPQAHYTDLRLAPGQVVSLYLATDAGIYHSPDAGASWQQVSTTAATRLDFIGAGADTQVVLAASGTKPLLTLAANFATPTVVAAHQPNPADPVAAAFGAANFPGPDDATAIYFQETHHNLGGDFLRYWRQFDGLRVFGYPLTEEFAEGGLKVQYFERVRLEYHQDFAEANQEPVVITRLGSQLTQGRYFITARFFAPDPSRIYFVETKHSIQHGFYTYWQKNGGIAVFGYPISEEVKEGDYVVQWFERAKFEYRPEYAGTENEVQETQLGRQLLRERGWIEQR